MLGYFFYNANGLLVQYLSNGVIVNNEIVDVVEVKLPAVTVCDGDIFPCAGVMYKNESLSSSCEGKNFHELTNLFKKSAHCYDTNKMKFTNSCNQTFSASHPGCVTFNPLQTIRQRVPGSHLKALFVVAPTNKKSVYVFLHNINEVPSWVDHSSYKLTSTGKYNVISKQRNIKRLGAPFKSNCSSTDDLKQGGFPYSKSLCHNSCYARDMFDACGTVTDFWKQYLASFKNKTDVQSKSSKEIERDKKCLGDFVFDTGARQPCKCINLCQETQYHVELKKFIMTNKYTYLTVYSEDLQISTTTELAAYDSTRFLADMGGLIGLLIGMSLLSVFEVIVCLALYAFEKLCLLLLKFM